MPTYDYRCLKCSNIQEEFHSVSDESNVLCNKCCSLCEKIIISSSSFIMKGDGCTTSNDKIKRSMFEKNSKMKRRMKERESSGEGVKNIGDLKKR